MQPEDIRSRVLVSADPDQHVQWLRERLDLGFETLDVHNVGKHQQQFIEVFGRHVLPTFDQDPVHRTTRQREASLAVPAV